MTDHRAPALPPGQRAAGLLLHVTSLPSRHGIGDLGPGAIAWIDRLHESGQQWWQGLPVGPTGWGDSPYQPLSTLAGNGLLISPDLLVEDGLLQPGDVEGRWFPALAVDYEAVTAYKVGLLRAAWRRLEAGARPDLKRQLEQFCARQADWLDDYALFRALKARYPGHYLEWPADLVQRRPAALDRARREAADDVRLVGFTQFLLARQAAALRAHATTRGVRLIGDLPFFVSPDSSDAWAHPELFLLDAGRRPRVVAGVPPDMFAADGQLWGNPVYDWSALRATGYRWWIERVRGLLAHVDVIRLDHFRAFAAAWHVPAGAATARPGQWVEGPGADFFEALVRALGPLPFVAEDLGLITPDVVKLRDGFGLAGTRVLQFAFDGEPGNVHLPRNYPANAVAYTGTHDNPTTRGWYEGLGAAERQHVWRVLGRSLRESRQAAPALLALAWSSPAALAIAPFQDVLNLGDEARMNVPGRADGNWRWRCTRDTLEPGVLEPLRALTASAGRAPRAEPGSTRTC